MEDHANALIDWLLEHADVNFGGYSRAQVLDVLRAVKSAVEDMGDGE